MGRATERRFFRLAMASKRGQTTQEAAIVISMAVVAIITMSTFVRRTLQGRIHDAARLESESAAGGGDVPMQYEPYYLESAIPNQAVTKTIIRTDSESHFLVTPTTATASSTSNTTRKVGSFQDEYPPQ